MKGFRRFWTFSLLLAVACSAVGLLALARDGTGEKTISGRLTLDEMERLHGGAVEAHPEGCAIYNVEPNPCDVGLNGRCAGCFENTDLEQLEPCPSAARMHSGEQKKETLDAPNTEAPVTMEIACHYPNACMSLDVKANQVCKVVWDGLNWPPFYMICKDKGASSAGWFCRLCDWDTVTGSWTYEPSKECVDP